MFGGSIPNAKLLSQVSRRSNPLKQQLDNCKTMNRVDSSESFKKRVKVTSSLVENT